MQSWLAPAKLNLFLHITGRRADGYHELQTVFQLLDFGDELAFELRHDRVVQRSSMGDGLPGADLSVRAARLLQQRYGVGRGVTVRLVKRIPVGAGLGGGSSDAATTLLALNRLWSLDLPRSTLMELGLALGADVPAFVFGHSAWGEGIGERLTAMEVPEHWYCVLVPPVVVSTARVYADRELTRDTRPIKIGDFLAGRTANLLEPVTCRLYPQVGRALDYLRRFGAARMSGSGAAVYVAVADAAGGRAILAGAPYDGFVARGRNRHPARPTDSQVGSTAQIFTGV